MFLEAPEPASYELPTILGVCILSTLCLWPIFLNINFQFYVCWSVVLRILWLRISSINHLLPTLPLGSLGWESHNSLYVQKFLLHLCISQWKRKKFLCWLISFLGCFSYQANLKIQIATHLILCRTWKKQKLSIYGVPCINTKWHWWKKPKKCRGDYGVCSWTKDS